MAIPSQQRARIAVLNGIGSVGKSSIARALQAIASQPMLHVQMDAFLDMLPAALQDLCVKGVIMRLCPLGSRPIVAPRLSRWLSPPWEWMCLK